MIGCVRAGCGRPALAPWWQLCTDHTRPLLDGADDGPPAGTDRQHAASWDALAWAERISPQHWGTADDTDDWVMAVRCLAIAGVVTGRASGCPHTADGTVAVPVVADVRAPGVLRCPPCAEPVVAQATAAATGECDRCRRPTAEPERVAALAGSALIVVARLCPDCRSRVLVLEHGVAST
jgi:hypothetical protein